MLGIGGIVRFGAPFGRASRREFAWVFMTTFGLILAQLTFLMTCPNLADGAAVKVASLGFSLIISWVQVAAAIRRLHDLGKSCWLLLLWAVPIVGMIFLVWFFCRKGAAEPNRFGPATT